MSTMAGGIIATLAALLLPSSHWLPSNVVVIEGRPVDSRDVFGWQKQTKTSSSLRRRHHAPPVSSSPPLLSPLRRSENVFGWQRQQRSKRSRISIEECRGDGAILRVSSGSGDSVAAGKIRDGVVDDDVGRRENRDERHIPNIKLRPRKEEIWLPWPLGEMRNDFRRFAAGAVGGEGGHDSRRGWDAGGKSRQKDDHDDSDHDGIFIRGTDWVSRLLRSAMMPFPTPDGSHRASGEREDARQRQLGGSQPRYFTTPMAAATASDRKMRNKRSKQRNQGGILLGGEDGEDDHNVEEKGKNVDRDVLFQYMKLQASVRLRQLGYVGSDLSVHLPPISPILLFYYVLPSRLDPMRRLVKYTVAGAAISWMHSEATKYRRFSPLPGMKGVNVRDPDLPPFLPEELPWADVDGKEGDLTGMVGAVGESSAIGDSGEDASSGKGQGPKSRGDEGESSAQGNDHGPHWDPFHGHHWDPFQSFGTVSSAYRTWREGQDLRSRRAHQRRRARVQEQLLLSRKSPAALNLTSSGAGYALVTGASGGIGRALAVELARRRIPLILVARDLEKLAAVADDIKTHYGVPCRVLPADLSEPGCAGRIHDATSSAGLVVDVLVNNAGVCSRGDLVDGGLEDLTRILQVNVGAVTELSQLYGRGMKERRRGRILIVSSISGALPGCPSVAAYAGTKAYGKSLAASLGREMERYGVGVTCMLPGAVKGTSFASNSDVEDAICFHFPGYAKTPELVAGVGIKALMLGYPEVYPGWQNRAFVKMFLPMLPARASNMMGELAWNPWQWVDVMPQRRAGAGPKSGGRDRTAEEAGEGGAAAPSSLSPPLAVSPVPMSEETGTIPGEDIDDGSIGPSVASSEADTNARSAYDETEKGDAPKILAADSTGQKSTTTIQGGGAKAEEDAGAATQTVPAPEPLLLSPAPPNNTDPRPSAPLALLDFFNRDRRSSPTSSLDEPANRYGKEAVTAEQIPSPESHPSMMDKKDYDFRDRRLDY